MNKVKVSNALHISALAAALMIANGNAVRADRSDQYPDYYAARFALEKNDCPTAVAHLQLYLENNSYIEQKYPDHYFEVKLAMQQCMGGVRASGIGDGGSGVATLPDHPPMDN